MAIIDANINENIYNLVIFLIAVFMGIILDFIMFQIYTLTTPDYFVSIYRQKLWIGMMGLFQLFLNLIVIGMLRSYKFNGPLMIIGLFVPQSLLFKELYRTTYIEHEIQKNKI